MRRFAPLLGLLLGVSATQAAPVLGQRTDVLTMVNGDTITGEIKYVARGKLSYKTDDMGTLDVKWDRVVRLRTVHIQEVVLSNGRRLFGSLRDAENEGELVVIGDTLQLHDIVMITPIEATFLQRTSGFLDIGFTFAKANAATTFTTGWEAKYRGDKWGGGVSGSNYYQEQTNVEPVRRNNVGLHGERFITGRWAGVIFTQFNQNDELNLDLRTSVGGGARYRPLQNYHMEIQLLGGLLMNKEQFSSADTTTAATDDATSLEIVGSFDWDWFKYSSPKFDVDLSFAPFFSVTKLGRVRLETDLRATYEVFSDFNVGLTFRDSFDSDPPSEGASNNDFTVTLTVGWSWS